MFNLHTIKTKTETSFKLFVGHIMNEFIFKCRNDNHCIIHDFMVIVIAYVTACVKDLIKCCRFMLFKCSVSSSKRKANVKLILKTHMDWIIQVILHSIKHIFLKIFENIFVFKLLLTLLKYSD